MILKSVAIKTIIIFYILSFSNCRNNPIDREKRIINSYHEEIINSKGDSLYFISKNEINEIIGIKNLRDIIDVKPTDNISFFDIEGNIVYQAICISIEKEKIYIECFDLNFKKTYHTFITVTNFNNVRDLKKFKVNEVKVFEETR